MQKTLLCITFFIAHNCLLAADAPDLQIANSPTENNALLLFFDEHELVTATRTKKTIRKAPAIATVITARDIQAMGARDLSDVLRSLPSFGVSINEHGLLMFESRGIRTPLSEKILVMLDGHSLNKTYVGTALAYSFDTLPLDNVKQIEIVKGPGSALFGDNAFVATINIITKDADDIDGVEAEASFGSFATRHYSLSGGNTYDNDSEVVGSANYLTTDGPKLKILKDRLSIDESNAIYSNAPGNATLQREQADFFFKWQHGNWSARTQYSSKTRGDYIGFGYALTDDSKWKVERFWTELDYDKQLSDYTSANFKIYFDHFMQTTRLELLPEGFAGTFPEGFIGGPELKDRTIGGEIRFNININDTHTVVSGIMLENFKQYDVEAYNNFNPNTGAYLGSIQDISTWGNWNKEASRKIWAAYIQDEWHIDHNLDLTTGVRYDHYDDIGASTNPRIGLVWGARDNIDIKALYGRAFRAPNFVELYNTNNPVIEGNPDLKPETISTLELGLSVRFSPLLAFESTYFHNTIDNMIDWDTSKNPAQYANLREATVEGIELGLSGKVIQSTFWKLGYTHQDPRDRDTNDRLPYVPSQRAAGSITHRVTQTVDAHTQFLWTGSRPRMEGDARGDSPSYTTVDVAITLKNMYNTLEFQAVVQNLFDKDYADPDTSGPLGLVYNDFPRAGRTNWLTASYKF